MVGRTSGLLEPPNIQELATLEILQPIPKLPGSSRQQVTAFPTVVLPLEKPSARDRVPYWMIGCLRNKSPVLQSVRFLQFAHEAWDAPCSQLARLSAGYLPPCLRGAL